MRASSSKVRLRVYSTASLAISIASQMFWWSTPAQAQSFLQQLFGIGTSPQARQAPPAPRRLQPPPITSNVTAPMWRIEKSPSYSRSENAGPEGSGSYTTVCVRMCDGFHFPISFRAPRSRFYRDAEACRSRCGMADARLFYHPSTGSEANMNNAVDLTGRAYSRLPIAFLHRKQLVSGCGCRPEPWTEASVIRHEGYAVAEGKPARSDPRAGSFSVVAGNYPAPAAGADHQAQEDPDSRNAGTVAAPAVSSDADAATAVPDTAPQVVVTPMAPRTMRTAERNGSMTPPRRIRTADAKKTSGARPAARVASQPKKPSGFALASSTKLVWPGDQPTRTR